MGLFNSLFGKKKITSETKESVNKAQAQPAAEKTKKKDAPASAAQSKKPAAKKSTAAGAAFEARPKRKANNPKFLEITNEEMQNLKDEETYLDKKGNPFTGILFSQATSDEGRIQCEYKNGKRHGEYFQDHEGKPDQIWYTKFYRNGLKHGPETWWWEKFKVGKNPKKEKYSDDSELPSEVASMLDQMTKSHDVMTEINFEDGVLHGKTVDYNWNGGINFEIDFKEGEKDGVWKEYFATPSGIGQGALKKISIYKDDKHISSKYYDFDNDEITKEEALNDEEWGGEAWEQDMSFPSK